METIRSSEGNLSIDAEAFARVALKHGIVRDAGQPGAPPPSESSSVLNELMRVLQELWVPLLHKVRALGPMVRM